MCLDQYFTQTIVQQRLDEARALARRETLLAEFRVPWRVSVGLALVRLGERLAGGIHGRVRQPLLN